MTESCWSPSPWCGRLTVPNPPPEPLSPPSLLIAVFDVDRILLGEIGADLACRTSVEQGDLNEAIARMGHAIVENLLATSVMPREAVVAA